MYYVLKLANAWELYDEESGESRPIDKNLVETLKRLFPRCIQDNKMFQGIQVITVPPQKLANIPFSVPGTKATTALDGGSLAQGSAQTK